MSVMMQAFYWDCPREEKREREWWNHLREQIDTLAQIGFGTLWLPPVHKAANIHGPSMGYDPYDYYDLGEFDQKGSMKTWFGSKWELLNLIRTAHKYEMRVIADMVINHNSGADVQEVNPLTEQSRWTRYTPRSGKFLRNWECFHPNRYENWDENTFGDMPDLSHRNPYVFGEILKLARWMVEEIGFDGFRYDFVKGYGPLTVTAIQEYRYFREGRAKFIYGVAEHWDTVHNIESWVKVANLSNQNPVHVFDFPLRELLKAVCDQPHFSLRNITTCETLTKKQPQATVTFVENHDLREAGRPIVQDKLLAYSYILTHEGDPCVFWKDYFRDGLALPDTPHGIAALVKAHGQYAGGETKILVSDDHLYVMQRGGGNKKPGLIYILNNREDRWDGAWITTKWRNITLIPVAWWSRGDLNVPRVQYVYADGRAQVWAPPRGYVVYTPQQA